MEYLTLLLISLSLSMDAFSVSIIDGLTLDHLNKKKMVFICLMFGIFQALMPLIGHLVGLTFIQYIEDYDHWLSLVLLSFVGLKMIYDAIKEIIEKKKGNNEDEESHQKSFTIKLILIQAIATAIDALAVGLTLESAITPINVYLGILAIGITTFLVCLVGIFLGSKISKLIKGHIEITEIIGGIILILIGVKIVLNHLGYINF